MNVDESTRMVPKRDVTRRMRTGKIQGRTFWSNVSEIIRCCYLMIGILYAQNIICLQKV